MASAAASFLKQGNGYDSLDEIEKRFEENKAGRKNSAWRFFMKEGETKRLIFLTDDPPIIDEHQLKLDGKWGNHYTCLKNLGETCPLCEAGDRPSTVGFYAIIDRTEFTKKDNTKGRDVVRVLAAKFSSLKLFKKYSQKYKGLVGIEFEVDRTGDKSPNIGNMYTKEATHTVADIEKILGGKSADEVIPNWEEYLAPKDADALEAIITTKSKGAGDVDEESDVNFKA